MSAKKGTAEEIRRLDAEGVPRHEIATICDCSRANVTQVLAGKDRKRAKP